MSKAILAMVVTLILGYLGMIIGFEMLGGFVEFGILIIWLSEVWIFTESNPTESTVPDSPSTVIKSPILITLSLRTNNPLIKLLTEVCAANPIAIPAIPAAPQMADNFIPNKLRTYMIIIAKDKYVMIFVINWLCWGSNFSGEIRLIARLINLKIIKIHKITKIAPINFYYITI